MHSPVRRLQAPAYDQQPVKLWNCISLYGPRYTEEQIVFSNRMTAYFLKTEV